MSDWLVLDIADARLSLVNCYNTLVTYSNVVQNNKEALNYNTDELLSFEDFSDLEWKECIKKLCFEIMRIYPADKIILQECKPVKEYLDYDGLTVQVFPKIKYPIVRDIDKVYRAPPHNCQKLKNMI